MSSNHFILRLFAKTFKKSLEILTADWNLNFELDEFSESVDDIKDLDPWLGEVATFAD